MRTFIAGLAGCAAALGVAAGAARAGGAEMWTFDLSTAGEDVFWDSETAVDPGAAAYDWTSTITLVEVNIRWGIFNLGPIDVTDQAPPEALVGMGQIGGPAPAVVFDDVIVYPEPPETPGLGATLTTTIDAAGFGHVAATDVTLGEVMVDLGAPFGVQTVLITRVRLTGEIVLDPVESAACLGDLDGDGAVGAADLAAMLGSWGGTGAADLNEDGLVTAADLALLLGLWGACD